MLKFNSCVLGIKLILQRCIAVYTYIYAYIYVCVCVCVSQRALI
jgi:hypothetical protein